MKPICEVCEKENKKYTFTTTLDISVTPAIVNVECSNGHKFVDTESLKNWKYTPPTMDDVIKFVQTVMPMIWELQEKVKKLEIHCGIATKPLEATKKNETRTQLP